MGRTSRNRFALLATTLCVSFGSALAAQPAAADHPGAPVGDVMAPAELEKALGAPAETNSDDLYEVEVPGPDVLTHGPDLQLAASGASQIGFREGDPERAPFCSDTHRQQILYARIAGTTDRFAASVEPIRAAIRRANAVLNADSLASGGPTADYKVACDPDGEISVAAFESPDASFSSIIAAARAAGFDDADTDYTIFFDASNGGSCGIGTYYADERLSADNYNNRGGGFGVSYKACWFNETPMHENAHNQGAVQYSAPQSTGTGGHCWEEIDVMCYSPDGGDLHQQGTVLNCTDRVVFDCGYDTYFDSAPEPGEYLATNWNLGSELNRFIAFAGATDPVSEPEPITEPTPGPVSEPEPVVQRSRVLRLPEGRRRAGSSLATGGWREYRVRVGRHSRSLEVDLRSLACDAGDCNLDLYLRRAGRPGLHAFDCARTRAGAEERCKVRSPRKGRWFVGVYSAEADGGTGFTVRAKTVEKRKRGKRGGRRKG
jgi:hypothetical protein